MIFCYFIKIIKIKISKMSLPNTLAGKKKPAKRGGKLAQEERSAERTQEKKSIEKAKEKFKDEERKRFAILAKNPSDEDLDQFVSESLQDRELFVELAKFLRDNGELESYLSYIKNLKKTGDEFDSYTMLTLLQFIKSSKILLNRFEQSDIRLFYENIEKVISDETEIFQKHASTFITEAEKYALDMKIKSLKTRVEKTLETLPFEREPGKYGPRPNLYPDQYQEYDYRNLSKFWNEQEKKDQKEIVGRAPIWRPGNKLIDQNASTGQNDPFWNEEYVKYWNENMDKKDDKQSQNPLVISFKELEMGLSGEIKKSYLQSFGRNFS